MDWSVLAERPQGLKYRPVHQHCISRRVKGMEIKKSFELDDYDNSNDPAKVLNKFQTSFQTPKTSCSYREEASDLKQGHDKSTKKLDVTSTNELLMSG